MAGTRAVRRDMVSVCGRVPPMIKLKDSTGTHVARKVDQSIYYGHILHRSYMPVPKDKIQSIGKPTYHSKNNKKNKIKPVLKDMSIHDALTQEYSITTKNNRMRIQSMRFMRQRFDRAFKITTNEKE